MPKMFGSWCELRVQLRQTGSKADQALSKKDFLMRVKIRRKEAKESRLFLLLVDAGLTKGAASSRDYLAKEARELTLIFSAIISKSGGL